MRYPTGPSAPPLVSHDRVVEVVLGVLGPLADGVPLPAGRPHGAPPVAVVPIAVHVQLGLDLVSEEGLVVRREGQRRDARVVRRAGQEGRNGEVVVVGESQAVDQHGEVRAEGVVIDVIDPVVRALHVVRDHAAEEAARAEAHDAEARGVDPQAAGLAPDEAQRPLGILQGAPEGGGVGRPVLQHEGGVAQGVQPERDVRPLLVPGQELVASARDDDDGRVLEASAAGIHGEGVEPRHRHVVVRLPRRVSGGAPGYGVLQGTMMYTEGAH